jgi:hypothetical protein
MSTSRATKLSPTPSTCALLPAMACHNAGIPDVGWAMNWSSGKSSTVQSCMPGCAPALFCSALPKPGGAQTHLPLHLRCPARGVCRGWRCAEGDDMLRCLDHFGLLPHQASHNSAMSVHGGVLKAAANIGNVGGQILFGFLGDSLGRRCAASLSVASRIMRACMCIAMTCARARRGQSCLSWRMCACALCCG